MGRFVVTIRGLPRPWLTQSNDDDKDTTRSTRICQKGIVRFVFQPLGQSLLLRAEIQSIREARAACHGVDLNRELSDHLVSGSVLSVSKTTFLPFSHPKSTIMKGAIVEKAGDPVKVVDNLEMPKPGDDQMLVKSIYAGLNPV